MCQNSLPEATTRSPNPELEAARQFPFPSPNHHSRATYLHHGETTCSPFPVRCSRGGGTLQAPLCSLPRPVPRRCDSHQGNYKGKGAEQA